LLSNGVPVEKVQKFMRHDDLETTMGYKVINGDVIIDPEKAELVKGIFKAYAEGETAWRISQRLNMKPSTVSYILKNRFYADPSTNGGHEALVDIGLFEALKPFLNSHRRPYQPVRPLVTTQSNTGDASQPVEHAFSSSFVPSPSGVQEPQSQPCEPQKPLPA
jgi:hypothetical protein